MNFPLPEAYYLQPTPYVPNSRLPVLVYRKVLPPNVTAVTCREALERNKWYQGGVFKTFTTHHFHSVTHECYAVFQGSSTLLLGKGPLENQSGGTQVELRRGDVIVLPAGVSHRSIPGTSTSDYGYLGLYPEGAPKWDNNWCKSGEEETQEKARMAHSIPLPSSDPVYGYDGPLLDIWRTATAAVTAS